MRRNLLKIGLTAVLCAIFIGYSLQGSPVSANSTFPPTSRTGAPALGTFAAEATCAACHGGNPLNDSAGTFTITGVPTNYSANQEISITVTLTRANRALYGFQLTALTDSGAKAGDLMVTDSNRTQTGNGAPSSPFSGRQYIQHTFNGTSSTGTNQATWTFTWKAPSPTVGKVTFYAAGNAANGNGSTGGDFIYTATASTTPGTTVTTVTSVSAASFANPATLTPEAITAAFGTGLSQNTVVATVVPLPTQLDGTEVEIKDAASTDRNAGLFFVSPTQINYLVPAGTANGTATVSVKRSGTTVAQGTIMVDSVQPALFSANANGQGVAAAVLLRRRNGVDTFESVAIAQGGTFVATPIDLGPETDVVVLLAFGSGFRNAAQSSLSATIGGTASTFVAAAPVAGLAGLDQANILIPRSLIGRGNVDVVFTAGGKAANTVTLNIK